MLSPTAQAIRASLADRDDLTGFYAARQYQPLWFDGTTLRPEARRLAARIADAGDDNLDPTRYSVPALADAADPAVLAQTELALSRAYVAFAADLHRPKAAARLAYIHEGLAPTERTPRQWLDMIGDTPSADGLTRALRMNPLYEELRAVAGRVPPERRALVVANLERARAIPADPGRRFILVDTAVATLRAYDAGHVSDTMRVVVGKTSEPTPEMAARMSFVVLNPYWNLPPDLARARAKRVLTEGPGFLGREGFEMLSGWDDKARRLSIQDVDWKAVAAGKEELRMRQAPGGTNFMGRIKFMLPNRLGIYLHDTPNKELFALTDRRRSSGCVRLQDAMRLARWVFDGTPPDPGKAGPDEHVTLPQPLPVYITYLTVDPATGAKRADPYKRDPALLAALGLTAPALAAR